MLLLFITSLAFNSHLPVIVLKSKTKFSLGLDAAKNRQYKRKRSNKSCSALNSKQKRP